MATPARRSAPLRAVRDSERPGPQKSVAQAAKDGTKRELLIAMRDRIAEQITKSDCPPRELGVLTKRLQEIIRDIEQLAALDSEQSTNSDTVSDSFDPSAI